jgi:diaminopimelate decarboxylase
MLPEDLRAGDLVVMHTTGAYTYSMASNYNYFSKPPVIAVGSGKPQVWAHRETTDAIIS